MLCEKPGVHTTVALQNHCRQVLCRHIRYTTGFVYEAGCKWVVERLDEIDDTEVQSGRLSGLWL